MDKYSFHPSSRNLTLTKERSLQKTTELWILVSIDKSTTQPRQVSLRDNYRGQMEKILKPKEQGV